MYIVDDIAYANDSRPAIRVCGVRPLPNHHLWVRFNDGTAKDVDFAPILNDPAFRPLQDEQAFGRAYIDFNTVVWNDGEIDISPDWLYENGVTVDSVMPA